MFGPAQTVPPPRRRAVRRHAVGSRLCGGPAPPCLLGVHSLLGGPRGEGRFGVAEESEWATQRLGAASYPGCISAAVSSVPGSRHIASLDAPAAHGLPALISRCLLPATSYGLAPSCHSLMGLTGCLHSRHTSSLGLVSLPRSSRAGSRPLTPCNVLAAAERRSALNLCKMHHIRPRPRCIPRFHLPLKRYPWRLVVPEGHLDHRWGTLGPAGHLRVELPKRFGSGSWASAGGTGQARWRIARTGGWAAGAGLRREAGPRAASGVGIQRQKRAKPLFILDFSPIASHCTHTWK